jgi:hypothetical protein
VFDAWENNWIIPFEKLNNKIINNYWEANYPKSSIRFNE